jgi:hypothetical protein
MFKKNRIENKGPVTMETEKKKKGLLATIWESMTKTGGCCGPGESCCGPSSEDDKERVEKEGSEKSDS